MGSTRAHKIANKILLYCFPWGSIVNYQGFFLNLFHFTNFFITFFQGDLYQGNQGKRGAT